MRTRDEWEAALCEVLERYSGQPTSQGVSSAIHADLAQMNVQDIQLTDNVDKVEFDRPLLASGRVAIYNEKDQVFTAVYDPKPIRFAWGG